MVIASNLKAICCVYEEKIVKNDSIPKNVASIEIQKFAILNSDSKKINLIPNKSFRFDNL